MQLLDWIIVLLMLGLVAAIDLIRMFRRLKEHRVDDSDDGRVIGHMNVEDVGEVPKS